MDVRIHYHRFSASGTVIYKESFVADDGWRLTTHTILTSEAQLGLSRHMWENHMLPEGYLLGSLRKHYFYHEHFDILACYDLEGELAGYYSDIATPLRKVGEDYYLDDLFLDYWLVPGQPPMALDEDEFEDAVAHELLTPELIAVARATFARLAAEITAGTFTQQYIQPTR